MVRDEVLHLGEINDTRIGTKPACDKAAASESTGRRLINIEPIDTARNQTRCVCITTAGGVDDIDCKRGKYPLGLAIRGNADAVSAEGKRGRADSAVVQPPDDLGSIVGAHEPTGFLDIGHQVVHVLK